MSKNLNRRAMLAGAAALPATSVAAFAVPIGDDSELLALGAKLTEWDAWNEGISFSDAEGAGPQEQTEHPASVRGMRLCSRTKPE